MRSKGVGWPAYAHIEHNIDTDLEAQRFLAT